MHPRKEKRGSRKNHHSRAKATLWQGKSNALARQKQRSGKAKATLWQGKEGRDKPGGTVLMRRERS
jgi:hypothetical protein